MSNYAEIARHRKRARPLYLELRALGLEVWIEEEPDEHATFRIVVGGLRSLSSTHAERLERRIRHNEAGLAKVLLGRWDRDLRAIRGEGGCY